eukprot:TRINITY_DN3193_c4_g4_i1.p1 TRINITY_DN3193_c4_g4~~TRINITY_DN3193_c4_g4_i1.p1  ORF type:complete len:257 (+),score=64.08 TRINITY_DN3193_c4_g4_i1:43-771(+)
MNNDITYDTIPSDVIELKEYLKDVLKKNPNSFHYFKAVASSGLDQPYWNLVLQIIEELENKDSIVENPSIPNFKYHRYQVTTPRFKEWDEPYSDAPFSSQGFGKMPQMSNFVVIGYEWHDYNLKHYNKNNPPPNVVYGFRFNIHYLGYDNTKNPPEFYLQTKEQYKENSNIKINPLQRRVSIKYFDETLMIVFKSFDESFRNIAFEIPNRDWEINKARGYLVSFRNDTFSVYFTFKKSFFRR